MASDETPDAPAPRDRREAVREKALQVQARQSRARVVRRVSLATVIVAVIAAAAVVVTWTVTSTAAKPQLTPSNMTNDGIRVSVVGAVGDVADTSDGALAEVPTDATPTATPTPTPTPTESATSDPRAVDIAIYVDYLSPGAKQFQLANDGQIAEWISEGAATLTYHPVALLTPKSNGTKYSLRSAGAAACVATHAPDTFYTFNHALLERQPAIDSDGFSDSELADMAIAAGAESPKLIRSCIQEQDFLSWVQEATARALDGSLPGTDGVTLTGAPLVLVNGKPYVGALDDPKDFSQFVLTLSSHAYYTSTPTPTPTPSK